MPEDTSYLHSSKTTPYGTVATVERTFTQSTTTLSLVWFERPKEKHRTLEELCRDGVAARVPVVAPGTETDAACQRVDRFGQREVRRVVLAHGGIYMQTRENSSGPSPFERCARR